MVLFLRAGFFFPVRAIYAGCTSAQQRRRCRIPGKPSESSCWEQQTYVYHMALKLDEKHQVSTKNKHPKSKRNIIYPPHSYRTTSFFTSCCTTKSHVLKSKKITFLHLSTTCACQCGMCFRQQQKSLGVCTAIECKQQTGYRNNSCLLSTICRIVLAVS